MRERSAVALTIADGCAQDLPQVNVLAIASVNAGKCGEWRQKLLVAAICTMQRFPAPKGGAFRSKSKEDQDERRKMDRATVIQDP